LLGGGYADCREVYGEQTARDELVAELNHMDAAAVALATEIEPRVRHDLRDAIEEVKERARRQDGFRPREEDRMVLSSEADRALAPGAGLRRWYDFGATLGQYHHAALGLPYGAPLPSFAAVLAGARHVLKNGAAKVPVLRRLVSPATKPKAIRVRKLLCWALSEYRFETGTYPRGKLDRGVVCVLLGHLHDRLIRQVSELVRTEAPWGANGHGDDKPVWDGDRVLTWRGRVIREFRAPAENQKEVIEAFNHTDWERSIPNPFRDKQGKLDQGKLDKTVTDLNKNLKKLGRPTILFRRDGTGEGVNWEPIT
jgi:hypothetical protein